MQANKVILLSELLSCLHTMWLFFFFLLFPTIKHQSDFFFYPFNDSWLHDRYEKYLFLRSESLQRPSVVLRISWELTECWGL